jgi:two-component system chemotaxis response regulator CheY
MPRPPLVLSVGQCAFDHASISRALGRGLGARVEGADTADEAIARIRNRAERPDLVLVNRVGDRDGAPGLALIRAVKADPELADVPVMLVSNFAHVQDEAVALGALPGFGKAELGSVDVIDRLRAALPAAQG